MRRRLRNLLTLLSLLLCVAVCVLWARSHVVSDHLEREYFWHDRLPGIPGDHHLHVVAWYVSANAGDLNVTRLTWKLGSTRREPEYFVRDGEGWHWKRRPPQKGELAEDGPLRWIGVSVFNQDTTGTEDTARWVTVPLWLVMLPLAAAPMLWLRSCGTRRRMQGRVCIRCGYDLRATPDRCPECGHTTAGATA